MTYECERSTIRGLCHLHAEVERERALLETHLQQIESCGHFFLAKDSVFWFICGLLEYDRASILRWVRQPELVRGTESRVWAAEATLRLSD